MKQVLLTSPGERINRGGDFGCGVRRMLFAPNSPVAATLAQTTIFEALNRWLSSVIVVSEVKAETREETLEIRVAYTLKARRERRYLNLEVTP
jgi:phage baseplate assembly protein W